MKKILFFISAVAGLFLAASCQQELDQPMPAKESVTLTVETPEAIMTKAIADGQNVDELVYEVWITNDGYGVLSNDPKKTQKLYQATTDVVAGKATLTLDLMKDQKYTILFWAQVAAADAYVTTELTDVKYAKTTYKANEETLAAFYGVAYVNPANQAVDKNGLGTGGKVVLTRPFAQINLGTLNNSSKVDTEGNPVIGYDIEVLRSSLTVTNVPNSFNVLNGNVSDEASTITFEIDQLPFQKASNAVAADKTLTVNNTAYEYVGMNYIFAGDNVEVTYVIESKLNGGIVSTLDNTISSVPVAENFRTNIIGNLLTSKTDFEIVVDAAFNEPAKVVEVWNGSDVRAPEQNTSGDYEISHASELAWLAAAVNGELETKAAIAPDDFAGKTFVLTEDVDLNGNEWTPIGNSTNKFMGIFDGNGKTVKNLVITGTNSYVGLFGFTTNGEIRNLTVENAKVSGRLGVGVVAGSPYTSSYKNITVKGHVEVNGMAYVGGVGGRNAYASWENIKVEVDETSYVNANSVENGTAYRTYVGGVIGFIGEDPKLFKDIISNIDVKGSTIDVGGLFGIAHYGNQFENCRCTGDVQIYAAQESEEAEEIGGIAGVWNNGGADVVMTDCEFTGNVTTNIERATVWYRNLVGKPYSASGPGRLIIDNAVVVASAAELQAAVSAATGETTIQLGADIQGSVTVAQKQGVKITIDGHGQKFNGFIKVHSNSNHYADAALTIKNVNFETAVTYLNKDNEEYFSFIEALENGAERYSTNITVEACSFTATDKAINIAVALQIKSSKNAKALNCTANNLHSLVQAQSCDETVTVTGCTINGKNGVAFKQVKAAKVEGTTITASEYGIRFDGNTDNYGIIVKDNNVTAVQPLIVRKMTGKNNTIALEGTNTLTTNAEYQIVITNDSDDKPYVKPTGTYTLTGADAYEVYPGPEKVASWEEFTKAMGGGETNIKLTADITFDANYQLQKAVTIDLNGKSMTLPMINIHTKTTVKNGTINGKVYARKNSDIVFDNIEFSGAVSDNLSTEGHLAIQSGCKLYAKNCLFSPTSVSGAQTKPISFEGGSSTMKFENCEFKSSPYKKQIYFNSLSATATLDFTNCNFNNKTPNIMFAAAAPLTNLTMSGTTKLSTVTLEINRAKDAVTDVDLAYLREMIANNSFSSVRFFYAGGSNEYIR